MVVELSKNSKPTAEVALPGGVSGKPHSKFYDSGIQAWAIGQYFEAIYLTTPDSAFVNFSVGRNKE
jgi:acyl-homoserine lactone acylase PvdQ